jgi:hypothetical protein
VNILKFKLLESGLTDNSGNGNELIEITTGVIPQLVKDELRSRNNSWIINKILLKSSIEIGIFNGSDSQLTNIHQSHLNNISLNINAAGVLGINLEIIIPSLFEFTEIDETTWKDEIKLNLNYSDTNTNNNWEVKLDQCKWVESKHNINGVLDDWWKENSGIGIELTKSPKTSHHYQPIHLGLCSSPWKKNLSPIKYINNTGGLDSANIGLFTSNGSLSFVFLPRNKVKDNAKGEINIGQPNLSKLDQIKVSYGSGTNLKFHFLPTIHSLRLDGKSNWKTLINWHHVMPDDTHPGPNQSTHYLSMKNFLQPWNNAVNNAMSGSRISSSGMPWVSLPIINPIEEENNHTWPILLYGQEELSPIAKLRNTVLYRPGTNVVIKADADVVFHWQVNETTHRSVNNGSNFGHSLNLNGIFKPEEKMRGIWNLVNKNDAPAKNEFFTQQDIREKILPTIATNDREGTNDSIIAQWEIKELKLKNSTASEWLNIGSLSIKVTQSKDKTSESTMSCLLRGEWTKDKCDVFPEIILRNLKCQFKITSNSDPLPDQLVAEFDSAGRREDDLHSETEPLVHRKEAADTNVIEGSLSIRVLSEPGRNSVTEWRLQTLEKKDQKPSIYFQAKPFSFARLGPTEFDKEGGADFAIWRSDDKDGPQWRVPSSKLTFDLPSQSVAEEMERGCRFWRKGETINQANGPTKHYIDSKKQLRYRFSPPTRLTIRPSVENRRYNPSPNNFGRIMQGSTVESFITEIAYPIRTEFQQNEEQEQEVRIAETDSFTGQTSPNIPALIGDDEVKLKRIANDVIADDLGKWAWSYIDQEDRQNENSFVNQYKKLRLNHSAAKANFSARLAKYHLYDPYRKDGKLNLSTGLKFTIRSTNEGVPALLNPLPIYNQEVDTSAVPPRPEWKEVNTDVSQNDRSIISSFLNIDTHGNPIWSEDELLNNDWINEDGAIRAGIIHTIEFPSELVAVLRSPKSTTGFIESLAFSTLGASGNGSISFDEGRTTFIAEISDGQLSRLIKTRIGRLGVCWNKMKHVIVYERTTIPSKQFEEQQRVNSMVGWPVLRKTEEYCEPIEIIRELDNGENEIDSLTGFVSSSEFISERIYVDGGWGRDVGHGYEIPLWNQHDTTGFYPEPFLALRCRAGGDITSRLIHKFPNELYFYTNTEIGTGNNPDLWDPKSSIDCPIGPLRVGVISEDIEGHDEWKNKILDKSSVTSPRLGGTRRKRFEFAVIPEGQVNLQHGRGDTEMLAAIEVVSLARTDETKTVEKLAGTTFDDLQRNAQVTARISSVEDKIGLLLKRLPKMMLRFNCEELEKKLYTEVEDLFDEAAKAITEISPPPKIDINSLEDKFTDDCFRYFGMPVDFIKSTVADINIYLNKVQTQTDTQIQLEAAQIKKIIQTMLSPLDNLIYGTNNLLIKFERDVVSPLKISANDVKNTHDAVVSLQNNEIKNLLRASTDIDISDASDAVVESVKKIQTLLKKIDKPRFKKITYSLANSLEQIKSTAKSCKTLKLNNTEITTIKSNFNLTKNITNILNAIKDISDDADDIYNEFQSNIHNELTIKRDNINDALNNITSDSAAASRNAIHTIITSLGNEANTSTDSLIKIIVESNKAIKTIVSNKLKPIDNKIKNANDEIYESFRTLHSNLISKWEKFIINSKTPLLKIIRDTIGTNCSRLDDLKTKLENEINTIKGNVEEQLTGLAKSIIDDTTARQLEGWADELRGKGDKVGKGLKLIKAVGELPELPQLSFNADRAEYIFEDLENQINTSPFAAKLREIDGGLKELGIAIPTKKLLDQFVPEDIEPKINDIIKNLGGIDFKDFFKKFKLPNLSSDLIKITHGIDKQTRSAWVKAALNEEEKAAKALFEVSALTVNMSNMALTATTDMRIFQDGTRKSVTDGLLKSDWSLIFSGQQLVKFREVTVKFDGKGFKFNIAPDKVELHPSVKFISEIAKKLEGDLPPAIKIEKDERGIPVGASASLITKIDNPPTLGAVSIGPILMEGGIGLRANKNGAFVISTHFNVGSKRSPIFVQISWLGGGMWLESKAMSMSGSILYEASLGLALGSTQSLSVAGIARGSYSILLFASASMSNSGGIVRAGLSMHGSANILGMANAYIALLLEVMHQGGRTTSRGTLDVEIEICWCYTLSVHKQVQRNI